MHQSLRFAFTTAMTIAVVMFGCRNSLNSSGLQHNEGAAAPFSEGAQKFVPAPYYWAELTPEQVASMNFGQLPIQATKSAQYSGPDVAMLQKLVNAAHDYVITQTDLKQFPTVPRPRPFLVGGVGFQAFVTSVPVCLRASLSGTGAKGNVSPFAVVTPASVMAMPAFPTGSSCVETTWSNDVTGFVRWFNTIGGACRLRKEAADRIGVEAGPGCQVQASSAKQVVFLANANMIPISTVALLKMSKPEEIVSILYHEMAHYYRAHTIMDFVPGRYGYFYKERLSGEATQPEPLAASDAMAREVAALPGQFGIPLPQSAVLEGRSAQLMLALMTSFIGPMCGQNPKGCPPRCQPLASASYAPAMMEMVKGRVSPQNAAIYLKMEPQLLACMGEHTFGTGGAAVEREGFNGFATSMGYGFVSEISPQRTLADALMVMAQASRAINLKYTGFMVQMQAQRIGYYTSEQEADELSLELMAANGFDPTINAKLPGALARDQFPDEDVFFATTGMDLASFEDGAAKGWPKIFESNNPEAVLPPVGDLSEKHHTMPYRSFNMWREIRLHRYKVAQPGANNPDPSLWRAMLARMTAWEQRLQK